jgi:hypothetical protein
VVRRGAGEEEAWERMARGEGFKRVKQKNPH